MDILSFPNRCKSYSSSVRNDKKVDIYDFLCIYYPYKTKRYDMKPMYTISQVYDITEAFITDENLTAMSVHSNNQFTEYTFVKTVPNTDKFTLKIILPSDNGAKTRNNKGQITLADNTGHLFTAQTKYNIKSPHILKRVMSRKFFKLTDMAHQRIFQTIPTRDNFAKILCAVSSFRHFR